LEWISGAQELARANGVPHFNAGDRTARGPKGREAERWTRQPFSCAMILRYDRIQLLRLPKDDGRRVHTVVASECCCGAATLEFAKWCGARALFGHCATPSVT